MKAKKYEAVQRAGQWMVVESNSHPSICTIPTWYRNQKTIAEHIAASLTKNTKTQLFTEI